MMMKHIIGQSILQIIVMVVLVFWGELFIPESADNFDLNYSAHPEWKWNGGVVGGNVCSGRLYTLSGSDDYITSYD